MAQAPAALMKSQDKSNSRSNRAEQSSPQDSSTASLLHRILSVPTAPFREDWVRNELGHILEAHGIPHFTDRTGNLIAGVRNLEELARGFRIVMMAHMDHPGFHLEKCVRKNLWRCLWYGGAPFRMMPGSRVRVFDPAQPGKSVSGVVERFEKINDDEDGLPFLVDFDSSLDGFSEGSFGAFDFNGCELREDRVRTRAADDLAGCVIALGALIDQERERGSKKSPRRLAAIFTRAEEVGFVGCLDLLQRRCLPHGLWFLSLEASRTLPEAELGRGPVIRIGDKRTLFDSGFSAILWQQADKLRQETEKGEKPFRFQRRLMSGGTCEGTPLTVFGYTVSAIAVPLENYHNMGPEGPEPEMISLNDVEDARALCASLARDITKRPDWQRQTMREILTDFHKLKPLLKAGPKFSSRN